METLPTTPSFISCFAKLKDPRKEEKINHKLSEILLIVLCGTICGANSWRDYVEFGKSKLSYLEKFSDFANGIPSKNTIVLNMLRKAKMKKYNQSSLKGLKKIAGWDNATLDSIICQNF